MQYERTITEDICNGGLLSVLTPTTGDTDPVAPFRWVAYLPALRMRVAGWADTIEAAQREVHDVLETYHADLLK